jgi:hypothetical protein
MFGMQRDIRKTNRCEEKLVRSKGGTGKDYNNDISAVHWHT